MRQLEGSESSEVVGLICYFPLLQDLWISIFDSGSNNVDNASDTISTSPKLNGTLVLQTGGIGPIVPQLLHLPGGLHFVRICLLCPLECTDSIPDLVSRCSNTLESLQIRYYPMREYPLALVADGYTYRHHSPRHTWAATFPP
jgi:hypothetical protein